MNNKVYLASASPRRKELIACLGKEIIVCPQNIKEISDKKMPSSLVCDLAKQKMGNLDKQYWNDLVVSADTIVWHKGKIIGKPKNKQNAIEILQSLSNSWHSVYTGVCIAKAGKKTTFYCKSQVKFKKLSSQDIENYISNHNPYDKAGAYGIQDKELVQTYKGSYTNIVGLPTELLRQKVALMEEYESNSTGN